MGYNVKPGVVEKYHDTLEEIKQSIDAGRPIVYTELHPAHLARRRDQIHWFLRCAKVFPNEAGGRYANLRDRVKVSIDWTNRCVMVVSTTAGPSNRPISAKPTDPDEREILHLLRTDADREVIVQSFTPSSSYQGDDWLEQEGSKLGFEVIVVGDGPFSCVAKRNKPKRSAFDIIKR